MTHPISVNKLMEETRRLAHAFRQSTGEVLPVSSELARYDCMRLLNLEVPLDKMAGVDLIGTGDLIGQKLNVKARVLFNEDSYRNRINSLSFDKAWDGTLLVLFQDNYYPDSIYFAAREVLETNLHEPHTQSKKGVMSVSRFIAIAEKLWCQSEEGSE